MGDNICKACTRQRARVSEDMKTSLNSVQEIMVQWEECTSASESEKLAVHMGRGSTPLASKKCEGRFGHAQLSP